MTTRRQFCGLGIITFASGLRGSPKNRRRGKKEHHNDKQLYHGPLRIDAEVTDIAYRSPLPVRTTHRKCAIKVSHDDTTYVFRVLGGQDYLGEIVETDRGKIRVHVWSLIEGPARSVEDLVAYHRDGIDTRSPIEDLDKKE